MVEIGKPMDDGQWQDYGTYGRFQMEVPSADRKDTTVVNSYIAKHGITGLWGAGNGKCNAFVFGRLEYVTLLADVRTVADWAFGPGLQQTIDNQGIIIQRLEREKRTLESEMQGLRRTIALMEGG